MAATSTSRPSSEDGGDRLLALEPALFFGDQTRDQEMRLVPAGKP